MSYQFAGYGAPQDGFCNMPAKMVDPATGEWYWSRCGSAKPSKCVQCAEVKRRDVASIGRSGWVDKPTQRGFFVTLTAPGADVLRWDTSKCAHSAGVRCSGEVGCVVQASDLAIWHDGLGQRWSWFMTDLRREVGDVEFFKTWEIQRRGALHCHSMMRADQVSQRRMLAAVKMCAARWGFGDQVDVQVFDLGDAESAARKAGYIAKYASKSADDLPGVRRLNPSTGEIRSGGFRSWSSSRRWGSSMAQVQQRRCTWAAVAAAARGTAVTLADDGSGALDSYQGIYANDPIGCSDLVGSPSSLLV